jgi:hypothetical protein
VLGVQFADGAAKAYAFRDLSRTPVVNDKVGQAPIVVTYQNADTSAGAFSRRVGDRVLTFSSPEGSLTTMVDAETGSVWSRIGGMAIEGPLAGTELVAVPSFAVFWFAWSDFHPDTALYGS